MEMVGIMGTGGLREQAVLYLNDAKLHGDTSAKTNMLKRLKEILLHRDPSLLDEFVPHLMELQSERASPIRNYLVQMIEDIGLKHPEHIPLMVPVLLILMRDDTPAVARHAISTGSNLFRSTFEQVALQGIYSGHVDKKLEESWVHMSTLKDAIYSASQEHKNDGVRLLAIKFIEMVILLFTPEPNGSAQPPPLHQKSAKHAFNVAWLLGGHPVLDAGALGQEASRNLALLLDQLRAPEISKVPGPVAVVLVNSLASIARQRPSLYGRVLPVLLGLVPNCEAVKGAQVASVAQALRNAFINLLKCTHSGVGPWRERVISALRALREGDAAEADVSQTKVERLQFVDRNRPTQENGNVDEHPGKRVRAGPDAVYAGLRETQSATSMEGTNDSVDTTLDNELSPLQQMIAMIGALVAKGERAAPSVELLIASLPADMLADLVIENMRNLPHLPPALSPGANTRASSGLAFSFGMPFSTGSTLGQSLELLAPAQSSDHRRDPRRDPRRMDPRHVGVSVDVKLEEPMPDIPRSISNPAELVALNGESFTTPSTSEQMGFIPGISQIHVRQEAVSISSSLIGDVTILKPGTSGTSSEPTQTQSRAISFSTIAVPSSALSTPGPSHHSVEPIDAMDVSEAKPFISAVSELAIPSMCGPELKNQVQGSAALGATMQGAPAAMPVVCLDASQQLALWNMLLMRMLESYKQVGSSGGSELHLSLLARLIVGSDGDDDAWSILQRHILADYQNHKGHELAIHALYQLYAEKLSHEDDPDGVTVASTAYDNFLLAVAEGLRDALPPSDKSLSKLFGEAPMLPEVALKLLEDLCNPGIESKEGLETPIAERITQGLSAVWSLILLRPPIRTKCLNIALKCTVHELEEVRTKAIRLVANKLYPLSYISQSIEEFATKMLHVVLEMGSSQNGTRDPAEDEVLLPQESESDQVTEKGLNPQEMSSEQNVTNDSTFEEDQQKTSKSVVSMQDAQRCMSLYFALCTKKNSLLREIFNVYERSPKAVRQAVHKHMPVLIRTIGSSSPDVLQIIADPPIGSKNLVLLVLHVLTESTTPSPELIAAVKQLYESKIKDAKLLTPILSSLSKEEVLPIFPRLVALPSQDFKGALDRILQGSVHTGPALTPAEVLIAIHGIDPERDHIPLSMVKDACAVCFQQRTVFTQQVLAKVLNQLVEQTPLPMLFMRTVILAVGSFRSLVGFVMEILSRLVSKQIWKWPNLWIGFLKCADQTQPHSFNVLLQLPALHLEKALNRHPNLRTPLTAHASKPGVRSTLPRSTLVVLGLAQDVLPPETTTSVQVALPDVSTATNNTDTETQVIEPAATS